MPSAQPKRVNRLGCMIYVDTWFDVRKCPFMMCFSLSGGFKGDFVEKRQLWAIRIGNPSQNEKTQQLVNHWLNLHAEKLKKISLEARNLWLFQFFLILCFEGYISQKCSTRNCAIKNIEIRLRTDARACTDTCMNRWLQKHIQQYWPIPEEWAEPMRKNANYFFSPFSVPHPFDTLDLWH